MKKNTFTILLIVLLIFINGCSGYKPIFSSTNLEFNIANYSLEDNKTLGEKIYSRLKRASKLNGNNENVRKIDILIKASQNKKATVKDSSGKILQYKISLNIDVKIKDYLTEDEILNETYSSSFTYKIQNQYSDTLKLEERSINQLVDKTYQQILIKLSENIITK
jgi:hypothetical protein